MTLRRPGRSSELSGIVGLFTVFFLGHAIATAQTAVTTYHNDNYRTGWNPNETVLTQNNVNASQFGLLATVTLDDQVDAQPLVVPNVTITAGNYQGVHNVVYVVTGNDTVYAIDATSGTILLTNHLGSPVPKKVLKCGNNGPNVGITSTPVIDTGSNSLYLIAYTEGQVYTLHALNLGNLTDNVAPQVVSATNLLNNGNIVNFDPAVQRQRPALLEANGNIYAGFGSFCDLGAVARGWLLGWNAATLVPLASSQLNDTQATDPDTFFLSSIWMSGYGPAADDSGNVLFVTANSDPSGTTYDGISNIQESVIKVAPDLSTVLDLFTPDNWPTLDQHDLEFGSGGVMVLPDQPGSMPHLAVAAGKDGTMFFMDEDDMGGYSPTANNVLGTAYIEPCWCGESYFVDAGGARIVSSGGNRIKLFDVITAPLPTLKVIGASTISTGQNRGFFTSVSTNGIKNPIVWALSRPLSKTQTSMTLYAFNPKMQLLWSGVAGQWVSYSGDSNQVPTIANGMVYVASYQQLNIFGLLPAAAKKH